MAGACQTPQHEGSLVLPRPASLRRAFDKTRGGGGQAGVVLLSEPSEAWAARWALLRDARTSIDTTYFIVEEDVFGLAFLGHLLHKAREGVQVRLLLDGRGSLLLTTPLLGRDHLQELVATRHAEVRIYNPPLNQLLLAFVRANAIPVSAGTHHKMLVVDRMRAVTGGRNVGQVYFSDVSEDPGAVDDADVLVDGADAVARIVAAMDREFQIARDAGLGADLLNMSSKSALLLMLHAAMDAWLAGSVPIGPRDDAVLALEAVGLAHLDHMPPNDVREAARALLHALASRPSLHGVMPPDGGVRHQAELRVVTAATRFERAEDDDATDAIVRSISGARQSIIIESPYFVLVPRLLRALEAAERRGVAITVLTNSPLSTDNPPSQALFIDTWPELMARMPSLRLFVPPDNRMVHAKRAVFDDDLTLIGTYNIDPFSAYVNSEMVLSVWSRTFNSQNRRDLERAMVQEGLLEYRIARDAEHRALRFAAGHPLAGKVVVTFGPRDHTPPAVIERLVNLKHVLLGIRSLWGFDVVVW